jgi:hypothetical protein
VIQKVIVLQYHNFVANHELKLNFWERSTFAIFLQYVNFYKARFACNQIK